MVSLGSVWVGRHRDKQDVDALVAGCRCAHCQAVEPGTGERSAGVDCTLSSAQLAQSKGATWVGFQNGELRAIGRDTRLGEGSQAGHVMVGAHAEGQRQQALLQCGWAAGAAVLGAAAEAGPKGGTDKLMGCHPAPPARPTLTEYLAFGCHC